MVFYDVNVVVRINSIILILSHVVSISQYMEVSHPYSNDVSRDVEIYGLRTLLRPVDIRHVQIVLMLS